MHGTISGERNTRARFSSLPAVCISQAADQSSDSRQQGNFPLRVDPSIRPFAHLQRLFVAEPPLQGQSSRPASSVSHRSVAESRCVFGSSALRCFYHSFGRNHCRRPVLPVPDQHFRLLWTSTPLPGLSYPSGSTRSVPFNHRKTHLRNRPDLLSLPETAFYH